MSMPHFRPVHDAHAIVEQVIFFEFMPGLESAMPALASLKDELSTDFPASEKINTVRVQVTQQADGKPDVSLPDVRDTNGIRLSRYQPDGSLDAVISIDLESIGIFCHKYSSWEEVWPRQQNYIKAIFAKLSNSSSFLTGVGMKWTDQFIYEGDASEYDARELFKEDSPFLHKHSFDSGQRWHCHTGWFESSITDNEILNQLNIDAGLINDRGSLHTAATITHIQMIRAERSLDQLADFDPRSGAGFDPLSVLMEVLHDGNKDTLRGLLSESALERISLRSGQAG